MNVYYHHQESAPNLFLRLTRQVMAYARGTESTEIVKTADVIVASPVISRRLQTISAVGKLAASGFGKPIDLTCTVRVAATSHTHHPLDLSAPSTQVRPRLSSFASNTSRLVALR
jgi:hypothetical protein